MATNRSDPCGCCLKLIFSLGLSALILWVIYRPITPRYYITTFSLTNTTLATFNLQIENKNRERGIYHDPLIVTLTFGPNNTSINNTIIPAFYQGYQKTANKPGMASLGTKMANGSGVFRVAVESTFRYKVLSWKSGHHAVNVAGDVTVDDEGNKTAKKGIRLSSAPPVVGGIVPLVSAIVVAYWIVGI